MSGYLIGFIFSAVAAVLISLVALAYLEAQLVRCFMSLGCTDNKPLTVLLLMLCGYLLIAGLLALFARRTFNSRLGTAFLLNVAPLVAIIVLHFLWMQYNDLARKRDLTLAIQTAIRDAPAIHLGELYVKKVDAPHGGVTVFVHVPFTVERTVQARSLNILATSNEESPDVRYSSNPECNSGFGRPPYGFHIVDREYNEPPIPSYLSGPKIVSEQLDPGRQYYLLRELHFSNSRCRVLDYQDFDPKQLNVALNATATRQRLEER
ncbi:MAG TPA: hypothetical protein VGQ39_18400 [Pyrinomonadaceae bacterium]|jgi:biotin transporter BioY|nr:hypothetical protein [Pyrinomonadaceae bacterium]